MPNARFNFPTLIHYGPGVRRRAAEFLISLGFKRPLIVTDRGFSTLPAFGEVCEIFKATGLELGRFSEIWGNPVKSQVMAGVEAFRKHHADCIVGLGGGVSLDVAKSIALMVHHPGDLFDYEDDLPGARPVDQPIPCWIALPTTSGSGSEVGRSAVISDEVSHVKKIIFSPRLLTIAVFADPELTLDLPPKLTAATGMDAVTHLIEAFLAKGYHPICDGIALEGLHLASQSLARAVKEPGDIDARGAMMMAAMMGAIAFQKGLGVVHSCAHALSAHKDLHHGLANGVMIDWALKVNLEAEPERFSRMARTIGLKDTEPAALLAWLTGLKAEIGIPAKLSELGLGQTDVLRLSVLALADSCHASNPVAVDLAGFQKIFSEAI